MHSLPLIEIAEITDYIIETDNFQDVLIIADADRNIAFDEEGLPVSIEGRKEEYTAPVRLNALFMLLILNGEAKVSLDYVPYTLSPNVFMTIMPTHIFQIAEISPDFKGKIIIVDKAFLEEINTEKRSPSMANYMLLRKNPCSNFSVEETSHMKQSIQILRDKIRMRTHSFHKEVIQNAFVAFLLELANVMVGKTESMKRPSLSRKEEIMNDFVGLLVQNCKEEHNVSFYAEKLFITPQYLSLILKELSGKSANKWIDEALIVEAKILLKMPNLTVQQVADELNFSDQSTFGKFFKKNMGVSPMVYRKS